MGIAEAIAAVIVTLMPVLGWWLQRRMAAADVQAPAIQREAIREEILDPNPARASVRLDRLLSDADTITAEGVADLKARLRAGLSADQRGDAGRD